MRKMKFGSDSKDIFMECCSEKEGIPVIILPGGGYHVIADAEAGPVAEKFTAAGYRPYILHYSVSESSPPLEKGKAFSFAPMRELAQAAEIAAGENPGHPLILAGFSAGAHLALAYSALREETMTKAEAIVLCYPLIRFRTFESADIHVLESVTPAYPKTFLVHGLNDTLVNPSGSFEMAEILRKQNVPCEFHFFEDMPHAKPNYKPEWFYLMFLWLKDALSC